MSDRYTIELPVTFLLADSDYRREGRSLLDVVRRSPLEYRECLERFARYFKNEMRMDFIQYVAQDSNEPANHGNLHGFLFTQTTLEHATDFAVPDQFVGGGCFRRRSSQGTPHWSLDWIWLHPFVRNRGLLRKHWPAFRQEFGNFDVAEPLSPAMAAFLQKHHV